MCMVSEHWLAPYLALSEYPVEGSADGLIDDARRLWAMLGDIPVNDDGALEEPFLAFPVGTDREDIWSWFEEVFNISVAVDLMGY